jgi:hypothetical protein
MLDETAVQSEQTGEHAGGCQCGCGSKTQAPLAVAEQAARDEVIRARNKRVREPSHVPKTEGEPPFSNHSGQL